MDKQTIISEIKETMKQDWSDLGVIVNPSESEVKEDVE